MIGKLRRRQGRPGEHGQVMVLFSLSLLVLLVAVGFAIDGGFALYQYREAQNAADFAAEAAANDLLYNCTDGAYGSSAASGAEIVSVINNFISANNSNVSTGTPYGWTADYLPSKGNTYATPQPVLDPGTDNPAAMPTGQPPCGVSITVDPHWPPFIAQLVGLTNWSAPASAAAVNTGSPGGGPLTSIVALAEHGEHTILEAGDGTFNVTGTIFDNADGCLTTGGLKCSSWNSSNCSAVGSSPCNWDVMDEKESGHMTVNGEIESYVNSPFDPCFGDVAPQASSATCSNGDETITFQKWIGNQGPQYTQATDPVALEVPTPISAEAGCGTSTDGTSTTQGGTTYYYPGVYNSPVVVTGNAVFMNCSQSPTDLTDVSDASPGIFWFTDGIAIDAAGGDTVTGHDVLFVSQNPIPDSSNTGDGEPVIGNGSGLCNVTDSDAYCESYPPGGGVCPNVGVPNGTTSSPNYTAAGTNCNSANSGHSIGSGQFGPNPTSSQGLNDSFSLGGDSSATITLSGPQTGPYAGFVLWQLASTEANVGLDALPGENATVNLTGIVYDNSDPNGENLSDPTYWGGNSSLPYLAGGMLVAGSGLAYAAPGNSFTGAGLSGGNISIVGMATVDVFQTQGTADLNVSGSTFHLAGIQGSGAILTQ